MKLQRSIGEVLLTCLCVCVMIFGLVAAPTWAANQEESPTPNIQRAAEEVAGSEPLSLKEVQARSEGGLNEVQGSVDAGKMKNDSRNGKPDNVLARKVDKLLDKAEK